MDNDIIASERFDEILAEIIDEGKASALLGIPGVYEALAEHFNNEVLIKLEAEQPAEEVDDR